MLNIRYGMKERKTVTRRAVEVERILVSETGEVKMVRNHSDSKALKGNGTFVPLEENDYYFMACYIKGIVKSLMNMEEKEREDVMKYTKTKLRSAGKGKKEEMEGRVAGKIYYVDKEKRLRLEFDKGMENEEKIDVLVKALQIAARHRYLEKGERQEAMERMCGYIEKAYAEGIEEMERRKRYEKEGYAYYEMSELEEVKGRKREELVLC